MKPETEEEWRVYHENLLDALVECQTYSRIGCLNDQIIAAIAHDHDMTFEQLKEEWMEPEWE